MNIVHISTYPNKGEKHSSGAGGVASYTKNLVTSMEASHPEDVITVICNITKGITEEYKEGRVSVARTFSKGPLYFLKIYSRVKKIKPEAIHIQQELNLYGGILNAYLLHFLLRLLKKYRTVITLHGVVSIKEINKNFIKSNNSRLPVWIVKLAFKSIYIPLCRHSKKIIVHENHFKEILINEYKVSEDKVVVVHHGVEDLKTMSQKSARSNLGIDKNLKVCLFMGYLTGYKGLDLLIEGFEKYTNNIKDVLLIIGAGKHPKLKHDKNYLKNEYERLRTKANKLIGNKNLRWVGFIKEEEINKYYSAADVSVFPYQIAMSSSGPMSISIGYEKPFLASDAFEKIFSKELLFKMSSSELSKKLSYFFSNEDKYRDLVKELKNERVWLSVGKKTRKVYAK